MRAHLPSVDGLRGLAILLVFLAHANFLSLDHPLDKILYNLSLAGWIGVDLFFVLSGFLITGILVASKSDQHYYRNFFARRLLRIFPLYYGFLAFYFLLLPSLGYLQAHTPAFEQLWYWSYLSNFRVAWSGAELPPHIGVFWSLAVEEHFYLFWPMLVRGLSLPRLRQLCFAIVAGSLMLRVVLWLCDWGVTAIYIVTPTRIDGLAMGALVAIAGMQGGLSDRGLRRARGLALLCGLVLLVIAAASRQFYFDRPWVLTLGLTALAGFFAAILSLVVYGHAGAAFLQLPALRFFGKYSYGIYVLHTLVIDGLRQQVFGDAPWPLLGGSTLPAQLGFTALSLALTVLGALLSWWLIERRCLALKRYF